MSFEKKRQTGYRSKTNPFKIILLLRKGYVCVRVCVWTVCLSETLAAVVQFEWCCLDRGVEEYQGDIILTLHLLQRNLAVKASRATYITLYFLHDSFLCLTKCCLVFTNLATVLLNVALHVYVWCLFSGGKRVTAEFRLVYFYFFI